MNKKILIFGKNGWLAQKFNDFFDNSQISEVDITDLSAINAELDSIKPDIVINAAGKTGRPNIDWCEDNDKETLIANVIGPRNLSRACSKRNIYWVHLSSGCIFQGLGPKDKGFTENDLATPPSWYSWTKYFADQFLKDKPVLIIRLRLPIDVVPNPRNLINKLIKYPKVIDDKNSVTVVPDLLRAVKELIEVKATGIYNVVNPGIISPAEIMSIYKKIVDPNHKFEVIQTEQLYKQGLASAARSNCYLNTNKLQAQGIKLKDINQRIVEIIKEYKKNIL